jgi:hypothetical protein
MYVGMQLQMMTNLSRGGGAYIKIQFLQVIFLFLLHLPGTTDHRGIVFEYVLQLLVLRNQVPRLFSGVSSVSTRNAEGSGDFKAQEDNI